MSVTVNFTDQSTAGPSGPITAWAWDFGDGNTSTSESPSHNYSTYGAYTVTLVVTGSGSDGTATNSHVVTLINPASLAAEFTSVAHALVVTLTDQSTPGPSGPITAWAWNFGDGGTSSSQNPTHTYSAGGSYAISLTVTGTSPDGTSMVSHSVLVSGTVSTPLLPSAGKTWFGSSSSGSITIANVESSILNGSRQLDIVHAYRKLDSYDSTSFPGNGDDGASLQTQSDAGRMLFLNFAFKIAGVYPNGTSTWADLAAGNYDSHLITIAGKIKSWYATYGRQIFVSWGAESDGHNGVGTSGTSDSQFATAWQHIHNLFVSQGARSACAFVWDMTGYEANVNAWNNQYPGDSYVDWLAYDPYGKIDPATGAPDATAHLTMGEDESDAGIDDTGLSRFYKWANGAGAKDSGDGLTYTKSGSHTMPIMVAETGLSYNSSADSSFLSQYRTWWSDLTTLFGAGRYPLIRGWVFFPSINSYDPRLDVGTGTVSSPQGGSILANFRNFHNLPRFSLSSGYPVHVGSLLFSDEFDGVAGSKPDSTKWGVKAFTSNASGTVWDGLNRIELDGSSNLVITASLISGVWKSGFIAGKNQYSGTRYIEARAKVPAGFGTWAAPIWETGHGAPQFETDVCEQLGREPTIYHASLHNWTSPGVNVPNSQSVSTGVTLSADFHRYGAAIYPDRVDFYFDGVLVKSASAASVHLTDLTTFLCEPNIDLEMGGTWASTPTIAGPVSVLVDYVRVFTIT